MRWETVARRSSFVVGRLTAVLGATPPRTMLSVTLPRTGFAVRHPIITATPSAVSVVLAGTVAWLLGLDGEFALDAWAIAAGTWLFVLFACFLLRLGPN